MRGLCWSGEGSVQSVRGVWAIGEGLCDLRASFFVELASSGIFLFRW